MYVLSNDMTDENKMVRFMQRIEAGEKIEASDWMPEEYRLTLIKLISMHGISEVMGRCRRKNGYLVHLLYRGSLGLWRKFKTRWVMANC